LANLRDLSLYFNALRDSGLKTLLASDRVEGLRSLNIAHCELSKEAGVLLGHCERLAGLRQLTLWGNDLGDRGATALIRSPHLQQLEALDATSDTFSKRGHARLKAHFGDRYLAGV
jgi:Ran GTPase-activating protein (RanGAP) involved in mRNA processing and transport